MKKIDNGTPTYYLRSSVLGGQVIAELDWQGTWQRGYVYLNGQLLVIQSDGMPKWVHADPVVKSQRLTNYYGVLEAVLEVDAWGGETSRSWQQARQPQRYTSYERDGNGNDQAMFRNYHGGWMRFDQPDPYDGSYDTTDPQSFNRYSYVQNDPVNFVDPSGLHPESPFGGMTDWLIKQMYRDMFTWASMGSRSVIEFTGEPDPEPPQNTKPKAQYSEDKFKDCLGKMGVNLVKFDPNDRLGGFSWFSDAEGRKHINAIYTDMSKYNTKELTETVRGRGGTGFSYVGWAPSGLIGLNYVASDYAKTAALVAVTAKRIHEIGNSLEHDIHRRLPWNPNHPELYKQDNDAGMALEDCVFGGFVNRDGTVVTKP